MHDDPELVRRIAKKIVKDHGKTGLRDLINMFKNAEKGPKIAAAFGVTRQCVHQWKKILGQERITYHPSPEVKTLMSDGRLSSTRTYI